MIADYTMCFGSTDLPLSWLVTTVHSLLHAAADDVNAGRLEQADADVLVATLLSALRADPGSSYGLP